MLGEFDLIAKYFTKETCDKTVSLAVGDDCALLEAQNDSYLAITTDTLNEGIHYFKGEDPFLIGYKSLLVNVSDLASMGAKPQYFTLSITLKSVDESFLKGFSDGLFSLSNKLNMTLIGGNTSKGDSDSFTIEALGYVKKDRAMLRSNAQIGDLIFVTGTLGAPALYVDSGYNKIKLDSAKSLKAHNLSMLMQDRCDFAYDLSSICNCAIDISDGLVGDIQHILDRSHVGAQIEVERLPISRIIYEANVSKDYAYNLALFGGGDYELLFTIDKGAVKDLHALALKHELCVTCIGEITDSGILSLKENNKDFKSSNKAFEHF